MKKLDASGLSCPQPVLLCKKGLAENPAGLEILVDNQVALGNVTRFAQNAGYTVSARETAEGFLLAITR